MGSHPHIIDLETTSARGLGRENAGDALFPILLFEEEEKIP